MLAVQLKARMNRSESVHGLSLRAVILDFAFGGPDLRTLYLTARASLLKLKVKKPGNGTFSQSDP